MCDKNITTVRLKQLIENSGKTRKEIAEQLKCDTSTITKHYNGDRDITTDFLIKYANLFDVSADYLLGLSDTPTTDKDIQFICKYTGLSERAIEVLSIYNNNKRIKNQLTPIIDKLLKSHKLPFICWCIDDFSEAIEQKNNVLDCWMTEDLKLSENNEDKENVIEQYKKLTDKADLSLFRLQETITDFTKICCWNTLKEVYKKEDIFNDVINNYIGEEEDVFVNYLEVDGENNGNNP